jgi:hypothetical protein
MKHLCLLAVLAASTAAFAQSETPAPAEQPPAAAPAATDAPAAPATAAEPAKPQAPFSLSRAADKPGKSPYATDTRLGHPPAVYVIPMEGYMGVDIHPSVYDKILVDLKTKKPDLIVFKLNSSDGRMSEKYMEAVNEARKDDKINPLRLASGITDYRDMAAKLHNELDGYPTVMFVEDSRGISCVYALAWPYMFMTKDAKIAGLDIVASLGGGNDKDIKAKMFSAWTGIAKGILELGGRPQELCDALVRPDRKLSADIDGRATKWRNDTLGSWYVVDQSDEVSARFTSKTAEDTGLTDGVAQDMDDLMYLLGYPEYTKVDSGEKIFRDTNAAWRKKYAETKKWMEEYQQPMEDARDLGKRKQILEKMLAAFKQSPQLARMWEWTRGLTEDQLKILIEQLTEQIRTNQKQKQGSGSGSGPGGGGSMGGRAGGGGRPAGPGH